MGMHFRATLLNSRRRRSHIAPCGVLALSAMVALTIALTTMSNISGVGASIETQSTTTTDPSTSTSSHPSTSTSTHPSTSTSTTAPRHSTTTTSGTSSNRAFMRFNCATRGGSHAASVPVSVTSSASGEVVRVGMCIGTRGPYPFVVGTGVSTSVIDTSLASALHLKAAGSAKLGGSGCTVKARLVKVPAMRIKGISLAAQPMAAVRLKSWNGQSAYGVIGSDILGRFGAVRIDFARGLLSVPGGEGPAPVGHEFRLGTPTSAPPPALVKATPRAVVPMTVVVSPASIAPFTNVSFGSLGPYAFVVDTSSPTTTVASSLVAVLELRKSALTAPLAGVGCTQPTPTVTAPPAMAVRTTPLSLTVLRVAGFMDQRARESRGRWASMHWARSVRSYWITAVPISRSGRVESVASDEPIAVARPPDAPKGASCCLCASPPPTLRSQDRPTLQQNESWYSPVRPSAVSGACSGHQWPGVNEVLVARSKHLRRLA